MDSGGASLGPVPPESAARQRGPRFDNLMRQLAADDLPALLALLVPAIGVDVVDGAQPVDTSLPASTRTADLVARTHGGILHVEFVKDPSADLDHRMVDYRMRLRRAHPGLGITQAVLALRDLRLPIGYRDPVDLHQEAFSWSVVRICDHDAADLLGTPTTAAVAALARGTPDERLATLAVAIDLIADRTDQERRAVLIDAAATFASIVLPTDRIRTALKEAAMPVLARDTPLGRELFDEGRDEGRDEGAQQATVRFTAALLRRRFGDDPRVAGASQLLAELPDGERLDRIAAATDLDELTTHGPRTS